MIKKILRWLLHTDEWEAAYDELEKEYKAALAAKDRAHEGEIRNLKEQFYRQYPDHNLVFGRNSAIKGVDLLEEVTTDYFTYKLYKGKSIFISQEDKTYFFIQMAYDDDEREYTIRVFSDNDAEYAENCAREAFHYLTAEI